MDQMSSKEIKDEIESHLVNGDVEKAKDLEHEHGITIIGAKKIAGEVVTEMIKKSNTLPVAVAICEQYDLETELRIKAISNHMRNFVKENNYDEAIDWAKENNLPSNEINTIAIKAFNESLGQRDVKKALEYKHKYQLPDNLVFEKVINRFNHFFDRKDYESAMLLGHDYDISRKRTLIASIRAYHQLINTDNLAKLIAYEKKFNILGDSEHDLVDEADLKVLGEIFRDMIVISLLSKGNPDMLAQIVTKLDLFEKRERNPVAKQIVKYVIEEVINLHTKFLDSGLYTDGLKIVENFHLMEIELSPDQKVRLITTAEMAHNKVLKDNNLSLAKSIKENYLLYTKNIIGESIEKLNVVVDEVIVEMLAKGNANDIKSLVKEYDASDKRIRELSSIALVSLMKERKFVEAFNIVNELKIRIFDSDLHEQVNKNFEEAYKDGQMELAANIGYSFRLINPKVKKAAVAIWKKDLVAGKYNEALALKKKHKLPRAMIEPIVKVVYGDLIDNGKSEEAAQLRHVYRLNLSIMGLFKEVMKKLFSN
ncbi:MAG: hypothetical protein GY863_25225 [bacterium]|nr:hypothetical protein [bacterium]